jgi:hypothetical protein
MDRTSSDKEISRMALETFKKCYFGLFSKSELIGGPPVHVIRLDREGGYFLVAINNDDGLCGIVQFDEQDLSIESSALIHDHKSEFLATEKAVLNAVQAAFPQKNGWCKPFLAWQPCAESFDSMRPLWVVNHSEGKVYVTQSCEVFEGLTFGQGGGVQ